MILELKTFNSIHLFLTKKLSICIYFARRLDYKTYRRSDDPRDLLRLNIDTVLTLSNQKK